MLSAVSGMCYTHDSISCHVLFLLPKMSFLSHFSWKNDAQSSGPCSSLSSLGCLPIILATGKEFDVLLCVSHTPCLPLFYYSFLSICQSSYQPVNFLMFGLYLHDLCIPTVPIISHGPEDAY